ncbi:hypothetical protein V8F33_003737 [Rhypophila sp. PSN 637]
MAKISFLLGLATVLLSLVSTTIGADLKIDDLFTVQPGTSNGGCDSRKDVLNQWHAESVRSLNVAISVIDQWLDDFRVRESLDYFFGFDRWDNLDDSLETVASIKQEMQFVLDFLNNKKEGGGTALYPKDEYWLFCSSDFLTEKKRTDTALDKNGNEILDKDKKPVPIDKVPAYLDALNADAKNKIWWAGEKAKGLNGYYFAKTGRTYCSNRKNLGATTQINIATGGAVPTVKETAAIIFCPSAFDGVPNQLRPTANSYLEANKRLENDYNLGDSLPKSTTLIHELFHAIRGDDFLSGDDEKYDIVDVYALGPEPGDKAESNPESYVFFIGHMYHLFGKPDGNQPWSIPKNWDFRIIDGGKTRGDNKDMVAGAKVPGPANVDPDPDESD